MDHPRIEAERSLSDVADELGISPSAVAEIERTALRKLARKLRQQGKARAMREQLRALDAGEREA